MQFQKGQSGNPKGRPKRSAGDRLSFVGYSDYIPLDARSLKTKMEKVLAFLSDEHKIPVMKVENRYPWTTYGADNLYPEYLISLYSRSAKHNAILTGKTAFIVGGGFEWDELAPGVNPPDVAQRTRMMNSPNAQDDLQEMLRKTSADYELFGGFALAITWDRQGKYIARMKHVPFNHLRSDERNSTFYYTKNWINPQGRKTPNPETNPDYKVFPAFNIAARTGEQIYYVKQYRPGLKTYPLPDYIGSIAYIEIDQEIANFHHTNITRGFQGGFMINFYNGEPTPEQKEQIEEAFDAKLTGTDNARGYILNFNNSKDDGAEIVPLQSANMDKMFIELNKQAQEEIFTGHKITSPMLFGIKTEGQLGGRAEMQEAYELLQNTYINDRQRTQEEWYNYLVPFWGITSAKLRIKKTEPLGFQFSETALLQIMNEDEKRKKAGLPQIDKSGSNQDLARSLSAISPLVANNVLNSMTPNEIRSIVGLQPKPGGDIIAPPVTGTPNAQKMLKEADELWHFGQCGVPRSEYKVLIKTPVTSDDPAVIALAEQESLKSFKFAEKDAPKVPVIPNPNRPFEVRYSYELSPDHAGEPAILPNGRTREFCAALINLDRLYTRDEIDTISSRVGRNVWLRRGGWYTDPDTDVATPYCRHVWNQNIVVRNG